MSTMRLFMLILQCHQAADRDLCAPANVCVESTHKKEHLWAQPFIPGEVRRMSVANPWSKDWHRISHMSQWPQNSDSLLRVLPVMVGNPLFHKEYFFFVSSLREKLSICIIPSLLILSCGCFCLRNDAIVDLCHCCKHMWRRISNPVHTRNRALQLNQTVLQLLKILLSWSASHERLWSL